MFIKVTLLLNNYKREFLYRGYIICTVDRILFTNKFKTMEASFNETYGYLNIVANNIGKLTVKIFDTNGHIAKKICKEFIAGVQELDLNFGEWAKGTYILNAFVGDNFFK